MNRARSNSCEIFLVTHHFGDSLSRAVLMPKILLLTCAGFLESMGWMTATLSASLAPTPSVGLSTSGAGLLKKGAKIVIKYMAVRSSFYRRFDVPYE